VSHRWTIASLSFLRRGFVTEDEDEAT
jgi:hypothetical protein